MNELATAVEAAEADGWEPVGGVTSITRQFPHATVIWFAQAVRKTPAPIEQAKLSDIDKPRRPGVGEREIHISDIAGADELQVGKPVYLKAQKGTQNVSNTSKAH